MHDVIPHLCGGYQEMRDLLAIRPTSRTHVPGVRPPAGRAPGRHQHLVFAGKQVGQREGIPGATAPPQGPGAHDREPERHGRERVRHDDLALVAERQVARPGQLVQALGDHRGLGAELPRELVCSGRTPRLSERPVHRQPQILKIHLAILAKAYE